MSNTEQRKIIERLEFLSDCVTKGRESIDRNFHMSIPARPLEDADLVLSTAGCMIRDSYAEIAALRDEVEQLKDQLSTLAITCNTYRYLHDLKGSGHIETGRAWDLMRREGRKSIELLSK